MQYRLVRRAHNPAGRGGYVHIRSMLRIPFAGGEFEFTSFGFKYLIARHAIDIAQSDVCGSGGCTELKKIAAMANSFGVQVVPKVWNSIIGVAASLRFVASLPNCPSTANPKPFRQQAGIEFDRSHNPLRDSFAEGVLQLKDGRLQVPKAPGLGVSIQEQQFEPWLEQGDVERLSAVYR
jgi:D-galactarolactone cycloisomerase